ncbi:MAG TPA: glycoside hydrolase family 31 protein [Clostridia bacterium]
MNSQDDVSNVMHGLSNQHDAGVGKEGGAPVFFNVARFPKLTEMRAATLLLPGRILSWRLAGSAVELRVEGVFQRQEFSYRYFDFRPAFRRLADTRTMTVRLSFAGRKTLRIQAAEGFCVPENATEMLSGFVPEPVSITVEELPGGIGDEGLLRIAGDSLEVFLDRGQWNLSVADAGGGVFYRQHGRDERTIMPYEVCPFGFLYDTESGEKLSCEAVSYREDEHFYGFGEKFMDLDRKGRLIDLWNTNALGTNTERAYKNIPFFISSKGYGLYINSSAKIRLDMGHTLYKAWAMMSGSPDIDYFLIRGTGIRDILPGYTALTGKACMPPRWTFGLWMSKISYGTREQVEAVARRMRAERIPCDVIHIDTDWFEENWICDWKFSDKKFPRVREMIAGLAADGYKLSLWQLPYIERGGISTEVYDEGVAKGYFAAAPEGGLPYPHGLIDFSNPDAVAWYQEKLIRPLLEMGIQAIKVDFGESAPENYRYASVDGRDMHNLYALLYNKAVYEITERVHGKENAVIWARSAWAGSQRYPLHWGGDAGTDLPAMATSIKGCLSLGLSGFPFWTSDIGGFWFASNPRLFARWSGFGMFCSHARAHGFFTREPWDFGEEVLGIFRKFVQLRYRLIPYIYAESVRAVADSLPMQRALVIDYPDDPAVARLDTEYLFGEHLLVAPVLHEDDTVTVYLPAGVWTDFWTGRTYAGRQWLHLTVPLDSLPLFVRENAILPMGPVMQYVDEHPLETVTLSLYPVTDGESGFILYENSEILAIHMSVKTAAGPDMETRATITVEIPPSSLAWSLVFPALSGITAEVDGQSAGSDADGIWLTGTPGTPAPARRITVCGTLVRPDTKGDA